jgi:hypothetical protein
MKNTSKITFLALLIFMAETVPACAQTQSQNQRAVGNMYTTALNMVEARRVEDALGPAPITKIYMNYGQVIVVLAAGDRPITMTYGPVVHKLVSDTGRESMEDNK